jgi:hypothetical protein
MAGGEVGKIRENIIASRSQRRKNREADQEEADNLDLLTDIDKICFHR